MRTVIVHESTPHRYIADSTSDETKFYWEATDTRRRPVGHGWTSSLAQAKRNLSNYIKRNQNAVYGNGSETPVGARCEPSKPTEDRSRSTANQHPTTR